MNNCPGTEPEPKPGINWRRLLPTTWMVVRPDIYLSPITFWSIRIHALNISMISTESLLHPCCQCFWVCGRNFMFISSTSDWYSKCDFNFEKKIFSKLETKCSISINIPTGLLLLFRCVLLISKLAFIYFRNHTFHSHVWILSRHVSGSHTNTIFLLISHRTCSQIFERTLKVTWNPTQAPQKSLLGYLNFRGVKYSLSNVWPLKCYPQTVVEVT